jgi:hypothetical protein
MSETPGSLSDELLDSSLSEFQYESSLSSSSSSFASDFLNFDASS